MKKKEMAELFDELGECALKTRVIPAGKQANRVGQESMEFALVAMAATFAFCATVSAGIAAEPRAGMGEAGRYEAVGCILAAALEMDAEDSE